MKYLIKPLLLQDRAKTSSVLLAVVNQSKNIQLSEENVICILKFNPLKSFQHEKRVIKLLQSKGINNIVGLHVDYDLFGGENENTKLIASDQLCHLMNKDKFDLSDAVTHFWLQKLLHPQLNINHLMCLQFISGGDLYDWLENYINNSLNPSFVPLSVAKGLILQILKIVQGCHEKAQICHMDLKLEQFLINPVNGELFLCDFETATDMAQKDHVGEINIYSPLYASPERVILNNIYTNKTELCQPLQPYIACGTFDIYALGIIFFTLLASCPPFVLPKNIRMLYSKSAPSHKSPDFYYYLFKNKIKSFWEYTLKYINEKESDDLHDNCTDQQIRSDVLAKDSFQAMIEGLLNPSFHLRWTLKQLVECEWIKNECSDIDVQIAKSFLTKK